MSDFLKVILLPGLARVLLVTLLLLTLAVSIATGAESPKKDPRMDRVRAAIRVKDFERAAGLLSAMAASGDTDAQYQLAGLFSSGRGGARDKAKAFEWMRAAAKNGHTRAQYNLGVMYENGWGVDPDRE